MQTEVPLLERVERDGAERGAREARAVSRPGVPRALVTFSEISWRALVSILLVAVMAWALWQVRFVFLPVFVAVLLSTVLVPPAQALRRLGLRPALATAIVVLGFVALVGGVIALFAEPVGSEAGELGHQVRGGVNELADWLAGLPFGISRPDVHRFIDHAETRLSNSVGGIESGVRIVAQVLATIVLVLFLTFFFVKDGRAMWAWTVRLFPERRRNRVWAIGDAAWRIMTAYVRGIAFVACVDAVFIGLAMYLIGVPLVLPLSVLVWFAAFFPIVGSVTAGAACALVALVSGGVVDALLVIAATVAVQQLEGNLLYPVVVGRTVELHPAAIIVAVAIGGVLAGVLGAFVAVPLTAIVSAAVPIARGRREEDVLDSPTEPFERGTAGARAP
jgi:putative heme transporter